MNHQEALLRLAQGTLEPSARLALAQRALTDPALAMDMKLAMRLSAASAELARDWVAVAARTPAPQAVWWRPLAGVAASLAIVAAVLALPRQPGLDPAHSPSVALQSQSDRIGGASFEADSLSGGGFEAN